LIKNSQPFGKNVIKPHGGGFFLTRTVCRENKTNTGLFATF